MVKNLPVNARDVRDLGSIPGWERYSEGESGTHFSILAWRIPWMEEPGGLHAVHGVTKELDTTEATEHIAHTFLGRGEWKKWLLP